MSAFRKRGFTLIELLVVSAIIAILAALIMPALARAKVKAKRIASLNNVKQMGIGSQLFADEQDDGRLTGSLKTLPSDIQADDDLNWLYPKYVGNLKTFINPATKNYIRDNMTFTVLVGGVLVTKLTDLDNNAPNNGYATGHSYEVFGAWHNGTANFPRKTINSVATYVNSHPSSPLRGVTAGPSQIFIVIEAMEPHGAQGWPWENWPNPYDGNGAEGGHVTFADGHAEWIGKAQWNYRYELSEDEGRRITPYN